VSAWSDGRLHAISPGQKGPKRLEVSEGHQNEKFRSSPGDLPSGSSSPVAEAGVRPEEKPALVAKKPESPGGGFTRIQSSAAELW